MLSFGLDIAPLFTGSILNICKAFLLYILLNFVLLMCFCAFDL